MPVAFVCNDCPYVKHVEGGLVETIQRHPDLRVVGICSNDAAAYRDDAPAGLAEQAARAGWAEALPPRRGVWAMVKNPFPLSSSSTSFLVRPGPAWMADKLGAVLPVAIPQRFWHGGRRMPPLRTTLGNASATYGNTRRPTLAVDAGRPRT